MAKDEHHLLGKKGEAKAKELLVAEGYTVLETNYTCFLGEIDIIAREKNSVCFIEVKTRRSLDFGFPAEAIDKKKQKKIELVARYYLNQRRIDSKEYRFDIVEVYYNKQNEFLDSAIIRDAFEVGE